MKRREFMKALGIGTAGLLGLERLVKAMAGQSLSASEICVTNEVIFACASPVEPLNSTSSFGCAAAFNCIDFRCRSGFECGSANHEVTCGFVDPKGYNFGCTDFQCESRFNCYDVECRQGSGDFDCRDTFDCSNRTRNAQFSCDGTDGLGAGAQFNCHNSFTCHDGGGQRVWCEDFWCHRGDFTCHHPFSCSSNNYDCDSNFSCKPSWSCPLPSPYRNN